MCETDTPCSHRAIRGAVHECVGSSLQNLIESTRTAGDYGDSEKCPQESDMKGADAASKASEIEAGTRSDDDHQGNAKFE